MGNEPVTIMGAINAAITATLGVLTITEVLDPEVAGAVGVALAAWILVAALLITRRQVIGPVTAADPGVAKAVAAVEAKRAKEGEGTAPRG